MNSSSVIKWRPATTLILIIGVLVLVVYSAATYAVANFRPTVEVRAGSAVYDLWIADDEAERVQGLSGVESLSPNGGLLMKFDEDDTHGIWMQDMEIHLDIIWLNKDKVVVYIVKNAAPELSTSVTFTPNTDARYIIELPAGSVEGAAIKAGMTVEFDETLTGDWWQ